MSTNGIILKTPIQITLIGNFRLKRIVQFHMNNKNIEIFCLILSLYTVLQIIYKQKCPLSIIHIDHKQ